MDAPAYGSPIVGNGLSHPPESGATDRYATLITDADGLDAVNVSALASADADAAAFVEGANLSRATLLGFQEAPHSSVPDYRVRGVSWNGGADDPIELWVTDEADAGTDDVTVETLFVRVEHPEGTAGEAAPTGVVVHTEENATVEGS